MTESLSPLSQDQVVARQAEILDALPASIALLDAYGVITSANLAWRQFSSENALGDAQFSVGCNYLDICEKASGAFSEESRSMAAGIRAVLNGDLDWFSKDYPFHSAMQQCWFKMTAMPIAAGNQRGAMVIHVNITAERLADESLRESELRFRQLAQGIGDIFFLKDVETGNYLYVSPAYETITGRTCESAYANPRDWDKTIHPDDRDRVRALFFLARDTGIYEYECRIVRPDGSIRWVEIRGYPVRDGLGKITRIAGVTKDVTEKMRAADALQRKQAQLLVLFNLMPAMIWFKDTQNRILRANELAAATTAYTVAELEGRDMADIYPAEAAKYYADDLEVIRSRLPKLGIVEPIGLAGREKRWIKTDKVPYFDASGNVIGIVVMARDVTERLKAEERLKDFNAELEQRVADRTAELDERLAANLALTESLRLANMQLTREIDERLLAEQARRDSEAMIQARLAQSSRLETVGTMAAGIAHDFNTILGIINGYAEMLGDEFAENTHGHRNAQQITSASFQARDLVGRMLAFARQKPSAPSRVDAVAVTRESLDMFRVSLPPGVELTFEAAMPHAWTLADPSQLHQVLINLCGNARDAMCGRGKLDISIREVAVPESAGVPGSMRFRLTIADNGPGMRPEVQRRAFDPFFTTKEPGKGSGLGLSVVYGIVHDLEGDIQLHSEVGVGTRFDITLPLIGQD